MNVRLSDDEQDDNLRDSSPDENQDLNVSEDDETLDDDLPETEEEDSDEEGEENNIPFHKHPRWQKMMEDKRAGDEEKRKMLQEIEELKRAREEEKSAPDVKSMTPEEKAVYDLKTKYGFATKEDMKASEDQIAQLKEEVLLERFLRDNPDAAAKKEAILALAFSEPWQDKTYEQIWSEVFKGTGGRKVVSRKVKTGIKPKGSTTNKTGGAKFTREQIKNMSTEEFKKNEREIEKAMAEGTIK